MNAFHLAAAAFLALAISLPAAAQKALSPLPRPQLVLATPADQPIELRAVRIATEIGAGLAYTSVELTFYNPNRRVLEGELQFPLLDGQSVVGMAMELDGKLREAVPVEKARGQMVFEDVTRQRIDPALLQVTQGNNYKLRVYPILPERTKQVVIRYSERLVASGGRALYRLPLEYADRVGSFALDVSIEGAAAAPRVQGTVPGLAFRREGDAWIAQLQQAGFGGRGALQLSIPQTSGARMATQLKDGKRYAFADVPVATTRAPRALPQTVGLVWDSSGSGAARDHGRELALLDAYFARMKNGEVRLTRVRDRAEPVERFAVTNGQWRELRRALEQTDYDGATNLGAFAAEPDVGEYLVFSDGLANFGDTPFPQTVVPVFAVSASARSDPARLRGIAEPSGGRYIDLLATSQREAALALLDRSTRLVDLVGDGIEQLVAASPHPEGGRITLAGIVTAPGGAVRLTLLHPDGTRETVRVPVSEKARDTSFAAAGWARLQVAALEGEYELNRAAIRRLGRQFGLVTRETSLIVLDRVEDYARFEIVPPPELMAQYQQLVAQRSQARSRDEGVQIERVVAMFRQKEIWWNRDFPKGDRVTTGTGLSVDAQTRERREALAAGVTEGRATPPQARVAPPPAAFATKPAEAPAAPAPRALADSFRLAEQSANLAKSRADELERNVVGIRLRPWTPSAPYIARLREAAPGDLYRVYLDEKPGYASSTAFFLDAADQLIERGRRDLGLRVLSNLAEMDLENRAILRILGYRLLQAGEAKLAIPVFQRVAELAPEEPQSYRDLGLAYAADRQHQKAIEQLYQVVARPWHGRFPEVELIALAELNAIIATAGVPLDTSRMDPRLLRNLPLDLRVVLTWDSDASDMDLWVTDPNGERAAYDRPLTFQGGRMSRDFTGGYGPEEFSLRQAKPGRYRIEANFYGHRQQIVAGATTMQVKLQSKFGTGEMTERLVTLRLQDRGGTVMVGEFDVIGTAERIEMRQ